MTGYEADEQALRDAERGLRDGGAALREGLRALGGASGAGLGLDRLDAAAGQLLTRFTGDLGGLGDRLDSAADGVRAALAGYQDTEAQVTDGLRIVPPPDGGPG